MECYLVKKSLFKITRERKNHHTLCLHGCKAEGGYKEKSKAFHVYLIKNLKELTFD